MTARKPRGRGPKAKARSVTAELASLLERKLVPDLLERAKQPAVRDALARQHDKERAAKRTADSYDAWVARLVEQVGAAWALSCVFVRTLEDRGLLGQRRIAGEGAADSEQLFFELAPSLTARDYLLTVFREVGRLPGAALLGPRHNLAFRLSPSHEGARALLDLFREVGDGGLVFRFEGSDTRFLGDLYQDLSEDVRKRFALLQTPRFVERFILDLTLEPAIAEYGLTEVRLIDPTCGSGHFLLGAFDRLFEHRLRTQPGVEPKAHALAALGQLHGVDLNPYAVAIARFRLMLAFLEKAGIGKLREAPPLPANLVVADSLLHGAEGQQGALVSTTTETAGWGDELFALDEPGPARRVFGHRYHAVVGNPPYITCKDSALRETYRALYDSCHGKYALAAPFTERFFQLAAPGGFVGLINANSFLKREFGKPLIERVLPRYDLTKVVDTSGAFIPGHGTPTVLLFGRHAAPVLGTVPAVLGKRGEPATPDDPERGLVWSSIAAHHEEEGYEDEFISVAGLDRRTLAKHPWSLGGGGAAELKERLEESAKTKLGDAAESIGISAFTLEDDVYLAPAKAWRRAKVPAQFIRPMVIGEAIRDWSFSECPATIFPYDDRFQPTDQGPAEAPLATLWPYRTSLANSRLFGSKTKVQGGLKWFEFGRLTSEKLRTPLTITFGFVATHNHFVLDRGGKVFNRTSPVIKLPADAGEEQHLALVGYLNSSTACFWLKQVCASKGSQGVNEGIKSERWEQFVEFAGTPLQRLPVPEDIDGLRPIASAIDELAAQRRGDAPDQVIARSAAGAVVSALAAAAETRARVLARMVALQEELDWLVYERFGLLTADDLALLRRARAEALPDFPRQLDPTPAAVSRQGLYPGHRAFEVVLDRDALAPGTRTAWFERNGYRSPAEIGSTYAPGYRRLIEARVAIIDRNPELALIERPEFKARWTVDDPAAEAAAARSFLLDRLEAALSAGDRPRPAAELAAEVVRDPKVAEVAALLFPDGDPASSTAALCDTEAVPYLAAQRHTARGVEKRARWEEVWALQRREDAGEELQIPVPPKYDPKDYQKPTFWRLRGKLDVPKERFISYPGAEKDEGRSTLLGWAGWDHLQRATALAALYQERKTIDGWEPARLAPLLAGLAELVPWVKQWHNDPSPAYDGERLGDYFDRFVENERRQLAASAPPPEAPHAEALEPPRKTRRRAGQPRHGSA